CSGVDRRLSQTLFQPAGAASKPVGADGATGLSERRERHRGEGAARRNATGNSQCRPPYPASGRQTLVSQFFNGVDYLLALPMLLLAIFGMGILMIDLLLPAEWKVLNAWTAFAGLVFSAAAVYKAQMFLRGHASA